jgi:hypothetical protein
LSDWATIGTEAASLYAVVTALRFHAETGDAKDPWLKDIRALSLENEDLKQLGDELKPFKSKPLLLRVLRY